MGALKVVSCFVFLIGLTVSAIPNKHHCGPSGKCCCTSYPKAPENHDGVTMDCSGHKLTSLEEICETVGNATRLLVNDNNISGTLKDDSRLDGCGELLSLSLKGNQIVDLEPKAIARLAQLRALDLSHNRLEIYEQSKGSVFSNLSELEFLALNGNPVNNSGLSLWYPDLSRNKNLTTLHIDGLLATGKKFPNLTNLRVLVMSGLDGVCDIQTISSDIFVHLINLNTLYMVQCDLVIIDLNAFTSLRNLERLDLSRNRRLGLRALYNVSYGLQFTNIKFLNYSHVYNIFGLGTELMKRDVCFLRNTSLEELALDGNRIQLLEPNVLQLFPTTLQVMHMNDNIFTFGKYLLQLACISSLKEFYGFNQNVAHNPMGYVDETDEFRPVLTYPIDCPFMSKSFLQNVSKSTENCFYFEPNGTITIFPSFPKSIKKVIFRDCNMKYKIIPMAIIPLQNELEYMDASGNVLHTWEGPIGPLAKLKCLDLSRNYCSKILKNFFKYMKWLENLQIHSNLLGLALSNYSYKDVFRDLAFLKTMNLSMNKITSLHPKTFEGLISLETLDLSFNSIYRWDIEVKTMTNLTHVNLSSNAVQYLPTYLTTHLLRSAGRRKVKFSIDLRNNVLLCGCQTKPFLDFVMENKASFFGFEEYIFVDEDGVTIENKDIEKRVMGLDKKCRSYTVWIVISVIGVSVSLSITVGGFVYKNRWKLRYFMYMSRQRFYGYVRVPDEEPIENYKFDAFISYAEENIRFVKNKIIPKIEQDEDISLCIHQRDFLPGNAIADNIIDAIKSSRKTVILLSKAFLKRKWCIYEFNMARMESIYSREGVSCLVVVMLEPVPTRDLPVELLEWIKSDSYLEYSVDHDGQQLFWGNLVEAIRNR